ncbi:MAG: hypothetical protein M1828_005889 [Chrysothrix sp. TS-e1954]|nr:MAG: hypothetical protein M1828_005889 [Chrysothrix sp. TS-e1954]
MEAAVRWSAQSSPTLRHFLVADVSGNRLQHCQVKSVNEGSGNVKYKVVSQRERLPNFTAFDWCRDDESLVAIGTSNGETRLLSLKSPEQREPDQSFPVKSQRKCNTVAFNRTYLLATGLDRIRGNDSSLNIYDLKAQTQGSARVEPYRKLTSGGSEVITNVKFFRDQPQTLIAGSGGIARHAGGQAIRVYDLREHSNAGIASSVQTKYVHLLSIDALDENYFVSACPSEENTVSLWDRRVVGRSSAATIGQPSSNAVLEIGNVIDTSRGSIIWSLRYSGHQRATFAVLSSMGQVKMFETAKYTASHQPGSSKSGPRWPIHYTKKSSNLEYSYQHHAYDFDDSQRAIAFDFATPDHLMEEPCVLTIRQDRTLRAVPLPLPPVLLDVSPTSDVLLARSSNHRVLTHGGRQSSIAEDLLAAQAQLVKDTHEKVQMNGDTRQHSIESNSAAANKSPDDHVDSTRLSSKDRHGNLHYPNLAGAKLPIELAMMIQDTARRRCFEGYLFDCVKNKTIVHNDPWLVELWDIIERFDRMAADGRMTHQTLDFSFLGVYAIWTGKIVPYTSSSQRRIAASRRDCAGAISSILQRHGYGAFVSSVTAAAETEYPSLRQIGLAICGWKFTEQGLREKCGEILSRRDYYKAIIVAVCHERRDVAIELLKTLSQTRMLENAGSLAALIAVERLTDAQREMCEWSKEEADDIYLRALLRYFISGDWYTVVEMTELPLPYRVAIALKYLPDADLDAFLVSATNESVATGDIEGIILTGLAQPSAVDLLGSYIARFNDVQTATLALAFVCPSYMTDDRFDMWRDTYFDQMQAWGAFIERARFTTKHTRIVASRGQNTAGQIEPPLNQTTLRCRHCQAPLARNLYKKDTNLFPSSDDDAASTTTATNSTSFKPSKRSHGCERAQDSAPDVAHSCPNCHRKLARCCLCLKWQGAPTLPTSKIANDSLESEAKGNLLVSFLGWCRSCRHGYHAKCAREWFSTPDTTSAKECAVPGCKCMCYVG